MINDNTKQIIKNYTTLLIGLFIMAFGVSLSVRCDLGTTPISSIPYVLSFQYPLSLGTITIIFNVLLILIQILILRSKFPRIQIFQIITTTIFGYFIDFAQTQTAFIMPHNLFEQSIVCILGCIVIVLGVFFEVNSKAVVLPGEGVSLAVCSVTDIPFPKMKIIFDTSNVVIALILSFIFFGGLKAVGIGTIFAGIVVGYIVRIYKKLAVKILTKAGYDVGNKQ